MDAESALLLAQLVRIVGESGDEGGVALPADMEPQEAARRLEQVLDGAGWQAIHDALNGPPSPRIPFRGAPGEP